MNKSKSILVILIAIIAISVAGSFAITGNVVSAGTVKIPLTEITETAKFYEYESGGTTIKFFVVKASDGTIKTGFDACDVCYGAHKGYRQDGEYMVCNNCGNKYPIVGLGTENKNPGGCWPGYLSSKIENNQLIIKESDIEAGKWRF